jgi:hypothetical protein
VDLFDGVVGFQHLPVRDRFSVDADSFVEFDQVRRGVKSHSTPGFEQYPGQIRRDRSFAVGAGYMDRPEFVLRVSESVQYGPDGFQAQFDSESPQIEHVFEALAVALLFVHLLPPWFREPKNPAA